MSKIAIVGCKATTRYLHREIARLHPIAAIVSISPDRAASQNVADYDDLSDLAGEVSFKQAERYDLTSAEDIAYFERERFDLVLVAGWQRIIPSKILDTVRNGVFGMHGSSPDLPYGRGRSPMNWSLIEGRQWFFTNLFKYSPGADDGPIAGSACFSINLTDTAETLHFKNLLAMVHLVAKNIQALARGDLALRAQSEGTATYYPKRSPDDGLIDWGADVLTIERHIRAVAPPFDGAFSFVDGSRVTIDRASLFYTDLEEHPFRDAPAGLICAVLPRGKFCVRCIGGVLIVHSHRLEKSAPAVRDGARFRSDVARIRTFPRNRHGYFDI